MPGRARTKARGRARGQEHGQDGQQPRAAPGAAPPQQPRAAPGAAPPQQPQPAPGAAPPQQPRPAPGAAPPQQPRAPPAAIPPQQPRPAPEAAPPQQPRAPPAAIPPQQPRAPPAAIPPQQPRPAPGAAPPQQPRAPPAAIPPQQPRAPPGAAPPQQPRAAPGAAPPQQPRAPPGAAPPQQPRSAPGAAPQQQPWAAVAVAQQQQPRAVAGVAPPQQQRAAPGAAPPQQPRPAPGAAPQQQPRVAVAGAQPQQPRAPPGAAPPQQPRAAPGAAPPQQPRAAPGAAPPQQARVPPGAAPPQQPRAAPGAAPPQQPWAALGVAPSQQPRAAPGAAPPQQPRAPPVVVPPQQPRAAPAVVPPLQPWAAAGAVPPQQPRAAPAEISPQQPRAAPAAISPQQPRAAPAAISPQKPLPGPLTEVECQRRHEDGDQGAVGITAGMQHLSLAERGGRRRDFHDLGVNTRQEMEHVKTSKTGVSGKIIQLVTNHIRLVSRPQWSLYQYHVDYNPPMESKRLRTALLYQHEAVIGKARAFDGGVLFLPRKLSKVTEVLSQTRNGEKVKVTITLTNELPPSSPTCFQFYNIIFRRILTLMNMQQIGRNYYNPNDAIEVKAHRLTLWPGFATSILQYESSILLNVDISHKVMRNETVLDLMQNIYSSSDKRFFHDICYKELVGQIILTGYNKKTYRIDEIAWDMNPQSTFKKADGSEITFVDYYKHQYNIQIQDSSQPLLVNQPKRTKPGMSGRVLMLVPELCNLTGLTDKMRSDYAVMKDLAVHTRLPPDQRERQVSSFLSHIHRDEGVQQQLRDWGLNFDTELLSFSGRVAPPERIRQRDRYVDYNPQFADWTRELRGPCLLSCKGLSKWVMVYPRRNYDTASTFLQNLLKVGSSMGFQVQKPLMVETEDSVDGYLQVIQRNVTEDTQMVVCVLSSINKSKYDAIKKYLCMDRPTPSQCVLTRTLSKPQTIMSVCTKILMQMNCKMGGELWTVDIPLDGMMLVGIDIYHDTVLGGKSVAGFIASVNRHCTRWFSRGLIQDEKQEIVDSLKLCMQSALLAWSKNNNNSLPSRIILYRDGVGDGQLQAVVQYEVQQLIQSIKASQEGYNPRLTVVVVKKRINARFFSSVGGRLQNPPPGTIIDSEVTRPEWYDFFIISQSVRQGTVSPTHYNVIYDNGGLKPDYMQRLTYKLCHMYYNWPRRLRHLRSIAARNIVSRHGYRLLDTYFTLHLCNDSKILREFYKSEVVKDSLIRAGNTNEIIFGLNDGYYGASFESKSNTESSRNSHLQVEQNAVRSSYGVFSLLRLHRAQCAIKQTQVTVQKIGREIEEKLRLSSSSNNLKKESECLRLKILVLQDELERQKKALGREVELLHKERNALNVRHNKFNVQHEKLQKKSESLNELRKECTAKRESFLKTNAQLTIRCRQLLSELSYIYPIDVQDQKDYLICDVKLPNSEDFQAKDDGSVAVALGYTAHLVSMISFFLHVPLRYPILHKGSRSAIKDNINDKLTEKEREFPLYPKGGEKLQFDYGVYLLNKNIAQLRYQHSLGTPDLRQTLPNLKSFLEFGLMVRCDHHPVSSAISIPKRRPSSTFCSHDVGFSSRSPTPEKGSRKRASSENEKTQYATPPPSYSTALAEPIPILIPSAHCERGHYGSSLDASLDLSKGNDRKDFCESLNGDGRPRCESHDRSEAEQSSDSSCAVNGTLLQNESVELASEGLTCNLHPSQSGDLHCTVEQAEEILGTEAADFTSGDHLEEFNSIPVDHAVAVECDEQVLGEFEEFSRRIYALNENMSSFRRPRKSSDK
ncbi:UV radiation resistance-associated gene protein isoform X3 [Hyperolius riggenbachi]|uniref:UV radiation resistance-associated gene protein isoform X3 n=1 Tax=Hyperolius riggenbachi TaxID=752182 RepID=UPI0035A2F27F